MVKIIDSLREECRADFVGLRGSLVIYFEDQTNKKKA